MISQKAKGSRGERELVKAFNEAGWACFRAAGSGSQRYPAPDLIAANALRRVAIECKVTKEQKKYFPSEEIAQLRTFSQKFGAESWIAVKFAGEPWYFVLLEDLEQTGTSFAVSSTLARRRGILLSEMITADGHPSSAYNHPLE